MPALLDIHIAGGRIGESIVVGLPDGKWGVIDCYVPTLTDPLTSATFQFLRNRNVRALEFLCLTHPDNDHFKGMSLFLENFEVNQFWVFGALSPSELYGRISAFLLIKSQRLHDSVEAIEVADDFEKTLRIISERRRRGTIRVVKMQLGQSLYYIPAEDGQRSLQITALGPSGDAISDYERSLDLCFDKTDPQRFLAQEKPKLNNNRISAALQIQYGTTNVVLGGDMEAEGWQDVLNWTGSHLRLQSNLVKTSHHGSTNGYCTDLWESHLSPAKAALGAVTAYSPKGLPSQQGVNHLKLNTKRLFTTSLQALSFRPAVTPVPRHSAFKRLSPEAVAALEQTFSSAQIKRWGPQGICSFSFDDAGIVRETMTGGAGEI